MIRALYGRAKRWPIVMFVYVRGKAVLARVADAVRARGEPLPLPPPLLRYRVHGAVDAPSFLRVGRACAADVRTLLGSIGRDLESFERVLDFGCGCGRVARHFADRPASCRLFGTDIDPAAIAWNRRHLGGLAAWSTNAPRPPLPYEDRTFDLVYGVSVFTHLDEAMQFDWLGELRRVSAPGGVVVLTTHGAKVLAGQRWPDSDKAAVTRRGISFRVQQTGRLKLDGLPDFYQSTFHTREYVHREWSRYFRIARYVEAGMNRLQDAVVLVNDLGAAPGRPEPRA